MSIFLSDPDTPMIARAVHELERHVARAGWDAPVRVFALVRTADALARDPEMAERLPREALRDAQANADSLTAVEQEGLPEAASLEDLLAQIAWPDSVDGAAVTVERWILAPGADEQAPDDEEQAAQWLQAHPDRQDVRLVAGVLRDGSHAVALRLREHDDDQLVSLTSAPGLVEALSATLT